MPAEPDCIGPWSGVKLALLREYAAPYSNIIADNGFYHVYIDGFTGRGLRTSSRIVSHRNGYPFVSWAPQPLLLLGMADEALRRGPDRRA